MHVHRYNKGCIIPLNKTMDWLPTVLCFHFYYSWKRLHNYRVPVNLKSTWFCSTFMDFVGTEPQFNLF